MKNKINLIIIVILLLVGGFVVLKYTQNNNSQNNTNNQNNIATTTETSSVDTSDWETCRNEEYGYEFKYPKNWYMYNSNESYSKESPVITKEGENCVGGYLFVSSKQVDYTNKETYQTFGVAISNQEKLLKTIYEGSKSLEDYWNKATIGFRETHLIEKKTNLDGEEVWWEKTNDGYMLWLFNKENLIEIQFTNLDNKLSNTIISNFKFIK